LRCQCLNKLGRNQEALEISEGFKIRLY
jgi:hypothetical protein